MCNRCKDGAENRKERLQRHNPNKWKGKRHSSSSVVVKKEKLYQFPADAVGKKLREYSAKEGVQFEEMVLRYLHYIASNLHKENV